VVTLAKAKAVMIWVCFMICGLDCCG